MTEPPTIHISYLPQELQLHIFDCLDYPSKLAFSQTCKHFRSVLPVRAPSLVREKILYLCDEEAWPGNEDCFACSYCLRLLHSSYFSGGQLRGIRAKLAPERISRVCLDCRYRNCRYKRPKRYNLNPPRLYGPSIHPNPGHGWTSWPARVNPMPVQAPAPLAPAIPWPWNPYPGGSGVPVVSWYHNHRGYFPTWWSWSVPPFPGYNTMWYQYSYFTYWGLWLWWSSSALAMGADGI
ncbi:hypothetical protein BDV26DRAFT_78438 [Aspergillus bertholletiae]|uniref:F-box domain-containing protein n=1 Tax=Aspergillus bertholletiae TaxID=1226010 RepID=A0A5N7BJ52_9EURO|nr:hypothetical protein BDV26DRAFT_78438 [Aspergillus bertholletiae]